MGFGDIQGQPKAIETLRLALQRDAVPHALLFHGPDGVGKELCAVALAEALICEKEPGVGCGTCSSCKRVLKRNHPDVTWVMPEDEQVSRGWAGRSDFDHTPSRDIRIEQVRQLQERLAFRALESKHKVALIIEAHAMNPPAQNALLKTLEEPAPGTVIVLVTSALDKLLPTIRSRCAKVLFAPLPVDFIAQHVAKEHKLKEADAKQVAAMAGGSMSRALELDVELLQHRREVIEKFEALKPDDARGWLAFAEVFGEGRPEGEMALDVLAVWFRDVAVTQAGHFELVNADLAELAAQASKRGTAATLHQRAGLLDEARNAITARNGAVRLQLERMLIEMMA